MKNYTLEELKNKLSEEDFTLWLKYLEKGKRLGEMANNPKLSHYMKKDCSAGMRKLHRCKTRILRKYNLI